MSTTAWIYEAPQLDDFGALEETLFKAFAEIRQALAADRSVVLIICDEDLLGHGDPAAAALAGGLVGLVRAFATEGVRDRWRINALSVPEATVAAERKDWLERLSDPGAISGQLIRLGSLHLGRVPL